MEAVRKQNNSHVSEGVFGFITHPLFNELKESGITIEGIQKFHAQKDAIPGERIALTLSGKHVRGDFIATLDRIISKLHGTQYNDERTLYLSRVKLSGSGEYAKQLFRRKLLMLGYGPGRELPEGWHVVELLHAEKTRSPEEARPNRLLRSVVGINTLNKLTEQNLRKSKLVRSQASDNRRRDWQRILQKGRDSNANITMTQCIHISQMNRDSRQEEGKKERVKKLLEKCITLGTTVEGKSPRTILKEVEEGRWDKLLEE